MFNINSTLKKLKKQNKILEEMWKIVYTNKLYVYLFSMNTNLSMFCLLEH